MRNKRYAYATAAAVVCVGIVALGYETLINRHTTNGSYGNPTSIARTVPFKIYQPRNLPKGYITEKEYAISKGDIISFSVKTPSGRKVIITQQARPAEINNSSFSGLRINTPIGKATISSSSEGTSAAVISDAGTLIMVNSTASSIESEIKTILSAL